ncbi:MAG: phage holin family protein [Calditrichaeota bacterium]|nr:phage holin family protein [Calditrichota bacterium]
MLRRMVLRIFINAAALWFTDILFSGIWFESTGSLVGAAIVFGLLNTFLKPVLLIFTLPINLLTLGLFTVVINGIILELTDFFVDSFHISSFGVAILAAIIISLVSVVLQSILNDE